MLAKVNSGGMILFLEGNCSNQKGQTLGVRNKFQCYIWSDAQTTEKSFNLTDQENSHDKCGEV